MSQKTTTPIERDLLATVALMSYSAAVAFGFVRVFSGWDFLIELLALTVIGHGVSFGLRRGGVNAWIAVPTTALLSLWVLLALRYHDTFRLIFPTDETWELLKLEVNLVRDQFQAAVAPVIFGVGWATLAGFAMIVVVVMADSFAFRAQARGESLVPGGVLFVFIAALGSPRLRILATVLLVLTGVLAVMALRAMHDRRRRVELSSRRTPSFAVPAAMGIALGVAVVAGVVGPRIPGAEADPLYETRGRGGGDTTRINPMVDIRPRLTNRGNVELFRVNADAPAYWRVSALPEFDGRRFGLPRQPLQSTDGQCLETDEQQIRQQILVLSLSGQLVPAAADPCQASGFSNGENIGLQRDLISESLVAPDELTAGDVFNVVSSVPALNPQILRNASTSNPPDPIFLELPDDVPDVVAETATAVAAGATTSFDQAIALQSYFREFDYSTVVSQGHNTNAIESFLRQRVGYCEQFSATFAIMARSLGIPSRVAVGYTPGVLNDEGWYSVLGKNAHAWPELWFDGIGWVAFEPTPGRGQPGAEGYTDVPAEQDESGQSAAGGGGGNGDDGDGQPQPTTPPTISPVPTSLPENDLGSGIPNFDFGDELPGSPDFGGELVPGAADSTTTESSSQLPWGWIGAAVMVIVTLSAPALLRWWRRRTAASLDPDDRVRSAWTRARSAAAEAGVAGTSAMTASEWAEVTAHRLPVAARPMSSLAQIVDQVSFAPPGSVDLSRAGAYGSSIPHDCELWAQQVTRIAEDTLSTRDRIRRYFTNWS